MCSQWGIQGRTAGAWTVWELPGVFLCVMHANPGPPRLQQRHKEASVKAESAPAPNSPHCLIKFSRGTHKGPQNASRIQTWGWKSTCYQCESWRQARQWTSCIADWETRHEMQPKTSTHTDKYCQFNRSKWEWGILFLWGNSSCNDPVLKLKPF